MLKIVEELLRIFAAFLGPLIGKIHFPKCAFLYHRFGTIAVRRNNVEEMSGREKLDTFETGPRAGHCRKCEDVIDALPVRPRRNHSGGQQPFDFGCKKEPVSLAAPKQRRDSEPIATELELARA